MFDKFDGEEDHSWHEIESIKFSSLDVEVISDICNLFEKLELGFTK